MKGDPEERAVQIGRYLVQSGATVRAAAQVFGVSKSTVWKDQCRLQHLAPGLAYRHHCSRWACRCSQGKGSCFPG